MKWRINFRVLNSNFNLLGYKPSIFNNAIPLKNGKTVFPEWYVRYSGGVTEAYIPVPVIKEMVMSIRDKIIFESNWADEMHKEAEELNRVYFKMGRDLVGQNLSVCTNEELHILFKDLRDIQARSHAHAISTTWFLDSDGEIFSMYLRECLKEHLVSLGINDPVKLVEYFILLTTPSRQNMAQDGPVAKLTFQIKMTQAK